ncbi:uncharacterized protein LOC107460540 [Arachis duranensis]|uniref:Uncharacterized protein LOC107460540 n=1 Tax=Arachis duranensis TaxID=130453 RepID=A0A6P4B117_ARADU|nr:uncharacterized protein LOC107460540 [Arachis duranensis]XP_025611607.1 uncharacterized protein LOC112704959 [Arachis hypogaea]
METEGRGNKQSSSDREEENEDLVQLGDEKIAKGTEACSKSLLGRLFADKPFSQGTLDNALRVIWGRPMGFRTVERGNNRFQFFFDSEQDAIRIERGGPWLFKDYVLHVQRWNEDENEVEERLRYFPVWAQFWGLPEEYKTLEVGRKLGDKIGEVIEVGFFSVRGKESRIVKAKIQLDGGKKARDSLRLAGPKQKVMEIGVRYERLGKVCTYCAYLGHEAKHCNRLITDLTAHQNTQDNIGEWVKADQVGKREDTGGADTGGDKTSHLRPAQPKKKPPPTWLIEDFAGMSMHDNRDTEKGAPESLNKWTRVAPTQIPEKEGKPREENRSLILLDDANPAAYSKEVHLEKDDTSKEESGKKKIKQIARQRGENFLHVSGNKRRPADMENETKQKKVCLEERNADKEKVEGASRQMAPQIP